MRGELESGFATEIDGLVDKFTAATDALQKGDLSRLKRTLEAIVKVAGVLITVIGALDRAKAATGRK